MIYLFGSLGEQLVRTGKFIRLFKFLGVLIFTSVFLRNLSFISILGSFTRGSLLNKCENIIFYCVKFEIQILNFQFESNSLALTRTLVPHLGYIAQVRHACNSTLSSRVEICSCDGVLVVDVADASLLLGFVMSTMYHHQVG